VSEKEVTEKTGYYVNNTLVCKLKANTYGFQMKRVRRGRSLEIKMYIGVS